MGLQRLDRIRGLPYGGAAILKLPQKSFKKPSSPARMVASVQEGGDGTPKNFECHPESWIGAINLNEDHVKMLRSIFKCRQCRTNNHTFPSCPLWKHWVIKKKVCIDTPQDATTTGAVCSAYVQSQEEHITPTSFGAEVLDPVKETIEDDLSSNVEFDLLSDEDDQDVTSSSGTIYPYSDFKVPLGSVRSASSSISGSSLKSNDKSRLEVIRDSGCTRHMFMDRELFITYKPCSHSFVILADKSRTACLGSGTVNLTLGEKTIILHDVLHVPSLQCPLLSVRCF